MKIAFLEDNEVTAIIVNAWLTQGGHEVIWFNNSKDCLQSLPKENYDLYLFDWELPDMEGPTVMANLKLRGKTPPVIFLTGRDSENDIISAIEAGADDYIVKPASCGMLLARIQAVTRRQPKSAMQIMDFGSIQIDFKQRLFKLNGKVVDLTGTETMLALHFFNRIGVLLSRLHLSHVVWGPTTEINTRTVDVYVGHLRTKLNLIPEAGWRITSIYGHGYRLEHLD